MELEYKIILGMYAFNWALSLSLYGNKLRFDSPLGVWMVVYMTTTIGLLVSLGDIWWKHAVLIFYAMIVLIGALTAMTTREPIEMKFSHFIAALLTAPVFLWLLLS